LGTGNQPDPDERPAVYLKGNASLYIRETLSQNETGFKPIPIKESSIIVKPVLACINGAETTRIDKTAPGTGPGYFDDMVLVAVKCRLKGIAAFSTGRGSK